MQRAEVNEIWQFFLFFLFSFLGGGKDFREPKAAPQAQENIPAN
jgi:hypothetical protein